MTERFTESYLSMTGSTHKFNGQLNELGLQLTGGLDAENLATEPSGCGPEWESMFKALSGLLQVKAILEKLEKSENFDPQKFSETLAGVIIYGNDIASYNVFDPDNLPEGVSKDDLDGDFREELTKLTREVSFTRIETENGDISYEFASDEDKQKYLEAVEAQKRITQRWFGRDVEFGISMIDPNTNQAVTATLVTSLDMPDGVDSEKLEQAMLSNPHGVAINNSLFQQHEWAEMAGIQKRMFLLKNKGDTDGEGVQVTAEELVTLMKGCALPKESFLNLMQTEGEALKRSEVPRMHTYALDYARNNLEDDATGDEVVYEALVFAGALAHARKLEWRRVKVDLDPYRKKREFEQDIRDDILALS